MSRFHYRPCLQVHPHSLLWAAWNWWTDDPPDTLRACLCHLPARQWPLLYILSTVPERLPYTVLPKLRQALKPLPISFLYPYCLQYEKRPYHHISSLLLRNYCKSSYESPGTYLLSLWISLRADISHWLYGTHSEEHCCQTEVLPVYQQLLLIRSVFSYHAVSRCCSGNCYIHCVPSLHVQPTHRTCWLLCSP